MSDGIILTDEQVRILETNGWTLEDAVKDGKAPVRSVYLKKPDGSFQSRNVDTWDEVLDAIITERMSGDI